LGSQPVYRYATGTITVRYLRPTPNDRPIELRARTISLSGRKARVQCQVFVDGEKTAEADVVGIRVFEGEAEDESMFT
jgi:predicted transcriptional regulator